MKYAVMSSRLSWPQGAVLTVGDLVGCNIDALVQGGHLAPVKATTKRTPAVAPDPEPQTESEQED